MKSRNVNRNISRARDDTHIFLGDPWSHWPTGQGKLNRKAQVALGEAEVAHSHTNFSKLIEFEFPKEQPLKASEPSFTIGSCSGVQDTMPPRGWIKCLKYLNRLHGPAGPEAFGYILVKNQEITFALAHLQVRQEQTTPTFVKMGFNQI